MKLVDVYIYIFVWRTFIMYSVEIKLKHKFEGSLLKTNLGNFKIIIIIIIIMYRVIALLLWALVVVIVAAKVAEAEDDRFMITMPGCNQTCVNSHILIPYPFGIGSSCYHNSSEHYEIVCKPSSSSSNSSGAFHPFLRKLNIRVFRIDFIYDFYGNSHVIRSDNIRIEYYLDNYDNFGNSQVIGGYFATLSIASERQQICSNSGIKNKSLIGSPFYFSDYNHLVVQGCEAYVTIRGKKGDGLLGGCSVFCEDNSTNNTESNPNFNTSSCDGAGCCLINMPNSRQQYYEIELIDHNSGFKKNKTNNNSNNTSGCVNVTFMDRDTDHSLETLIWTAPNISTTPHSHCVDARPYLSGCYCKSGFQGNPYIPYGCQAIPIAITTASPKKKFMIIGVSIAFGSLLMGFFGYGSFRAILRWRQMRRKAKFFKRNGGLLLQQQTTTRDNMVDTTKVFSDVEIEKATDNFNSNRILGRGGQGTVYKGMLLDGRVAAIKKALKVDESQIEQFINEVVILSQISHRNVVKLLGCCLETEVPLLVYEFIPNGTLSHHIHNPNEEFYITWKMRLQIAAESAGALTYLHSASATPIYHRDVKSSNILLDEKYKAKVADFGTSRTLMIDQTHLTTLVQGTLGYLDPEYFQTNQFTEKSDVYSFGVVLVELLTGQKPLTAMQSGGWKCLTMEFLSHMESSRLFDIVDSQILVEAERDELLTMANLAKKCLNLNGKHRPTMKEVASVLEGIGSSPLPVIGDQQVCSKVNNEIMEMGKLHDDHQLASSCLFSENNYNEVLGSSTSTEVNPLMHYTI